MLHARLSRGPAADQTLTRSRRHSTRRPLSVAILRRPAARGWHGRAAERTGPAGPRPPPIPAPLAAASYGVVCLADRGDCWAICRDAPPIFRSCRVSRVAL